MAQLWKEMGYYMKLFLCYDRTSGRHELRSGGFPNSLISETRNDLYRCSVWTRTYSINLLCQVHEFPAQLIRVYGDSKALSSHALYCMLLNPNQRTSLKQYDQDTMIRNWGTNTKGFSSFIEALIQLYAGKSELRENWCICRRLHATWYLAYFFVHMTVSVERQPWVCRKK